MLFNSFAFILFAPIFFLFYFCTQGKIRLLVCLIASYIFYSWWDYRFLSLIILITYVNHVAGKKIDTTAPEANRKKILTLTVAFNLGILGIFKYYGFFTDSFSTILQTLGFQLSSSTLNIVLPVGVSFYIFQALSYIFDIYRKKIKHETSLLKFATFVALFPQLVAGPIVRADVLLPQLSNDQPFVLKRIYEGSVTVLYGFFIKVAIADSIAPVVDRMLATPMNETSLVLIVGSLLFSFQIYCDFHGYSLIAIGLGKIMGFDFGVNFKSPYLAKNFSDFWTRWHISLSSWLRDYLYIPLGGSHSSTITTCKNLFITMFLGGLWHGANWTFVIWGTIHGFYLVIQHSWQKSCDKLNIKINTHKLLGLISNTSSIILVFLLTSFAWIFFRSPDIGHTIELINCIIKFDNFNILLIPNKFLVLKCILLISILMTIEILNNFNTDFLQNKYVKLLSVPFTLWGISVFGTFAGNSFIYFQF